MKLAQCQIRDRKPTFKSTIPTAEIRSSRARKISNAFIADNAAGHYFQRGEVDLVITGADRIEANGDFANKIGRSEKALLAKEHGVPF